MNLEWMVLSLGGGRIVKWIIEKFQVKELYTAFGCTVTVIVEGSNLILLICSNSFLIALSDEEYEYGYESYESYQDLIISQVSLLINYLDQHPWIYRPIQCKILACLLRIQVLGLHISWMQDSIMCNIIEWLLSSRNYWH